MIHRGIVGGGKDWGFVDDPSAEVIRHCYHGGAMPGLGHPHSCRARLRRSNPPVRCRRWAKNGFLYCVQHAPRICGRRKNQLSRTQKNLLSFYSARAGASLKERLEAMSKQEPGKRHSLADEVDLARLTCEQAVKLFDAAHFGAIPATPETQAAAQSVLRGALDHVSEIVAKAARVRAVSLDTVDVEQLHYIVEQVVIILEDEVAAISRDAVDRVTARMRNIKLPERRGTGGPGAQDLARMFREAAGVIEQSVVSDAPPSTGIEQVSA